MRSKIGMPTSFLVSWIELLCCLKIGDKERIIGVCSIISTYFLNAWTNRRQKYIISFIVKMIICHYFEFTSLLWLSLHNKDLFIGITNAQRKQKSNQGFRTFQIRVSKSFCFWYRTAVHCFGQDWTWEEIYTFLTLFDIVGCGELLRRNGDVNIKLLAALSKFSPVHSSSVFVHQSSKYHPTIIQTYLFPKSPCL